VDRRHQSLGDAELVVEHLVVAAQGYPRGVAKAAGRKAIYLGNFAAQRLDFFYVPAR
jgi:hypothetical protein